MDLKTTHANEIAEKDKTIAELKSDDDADKKAISDGQAEISNLNKIL